MFIPFEEISSGARVWIYQLNRAISQQEKIEMEAVLKAFCNQWQAHGAPLSTSFKLVYDHFLIVAVDEQVASASGCSIDGSVRILKELGAKMDVDFFDRTKVAILVNDKVELYPIAQLKELFIDGTLKPTSVTFNNLVATKKAYIEGWQVTVEQSWLARYLPKGTLA